MFIKAIYLRNILLDGRKYTDFAGNHCARAKLHV